MHAFNDGVPVPVNIDKDGRLSVRLIDTEGRPIHIYATKDDNEPSVYIDFNGEDRRLDMSKLFFFMSALSEVFQVDLRLSKR